MLWWDPLLVAEPVVPPAVRALPCDAIARHAPDIFMHAGLADAETASALPTKRKFLTAAVALLYGATASSSFSGGTVFGAQCLSSLAAGSIRIRRHAVVLSFGCEHGTTGQKQIAAFSKAEKTLNQPDGAVKPSTKRVAVDAPKQPKHDKRAR